METMLRENGIDEIKIARVLKSMHRARIEVKPDIKLLDGCNNCKAFKTIEEISQSKLKEVWNKNFSDKPFPIVRAFILTKYQFLKYIKRMKDALGNYVLEASVSHEWKGFTPHLDSQILGHVLALESGFTITVRKDALTLNPLEFYLEHELRHIYKKETKPFKK